jgi:phage-related protein
MKRIEFVGSSKDDLSSFPLEAKRAVGLELWQVQNGFMPSDFKHMLRVGTGAYEIRVHVLGERRVIYVARKGDVIYVLHAFQKKSAKTSKQDIELAVRRFKQIGE